MPPTKKPAPQPTPVPATEAIETAEVITTSVDNLTPTDYLVKLTKQFQEQVDKSIAYQNQAAGR